MSEKTIRGSVGVGLLDKADRLFRNDNDGVFIEVLQNARRAKATRVEIRIEETAESQFCVVTAEDNGSGIRDFQRLVALGDSDWTQETTKSEDPAGMGFYSLCHSDVEVHSGYQFVRISREVFLGKAEAQIENKEECVNGTRLRFRRPSNRTQLVGALDRVTEFFPLEVWLDGSLLPRHDFLEGSLYRETIDGIEVGFAIKFEHGQAYEDLNWNFYGARLRHAPLEVKGLLPRGQTEPLTVYARFQVLETAVVKLQLPDRRGVLEDDQLRQFQRKAYAAAYRFFQSQPQHALPYRNWQEAKELGVLLPEAAYLLTTWHAEPSEDYVDSPFADSQTRVLPNLDKVILVERYLPNSHTFEGALNSGATIDGVLYKEQPHFAGYDWYDSLTTIVDATVLVDSIDYEEWVKTESPRPSKIEVEVTIEEPNTPTRSISLPASVHVDSESMNEARFIAIRNSPWDNAALDGPFPINTFLFWATFSPSDDCDADSWDTQERDYREMIEREVNECFRGPRETLIAILQNAIDWEAQRLAQNLQVTEIHFKQSGHSWQVELISPPA